MNTKENKLYTGTATNATSRLVEHVTNEKGGGMVELIELATLIEKLNIEIKNIEKNIENTVDINNKNEKIAVYNKAIDELEKAHKLQAQKTKKGWDHVLPKKIELLSQEKVKVTPVIEEKLISSTDSSMRENGVTESPKTNEYSLAPNTKPEAVILSNQNQRGEPNTVMDGNMVKEKDSLTITNEAEENTIGGDKEMTESETKESDQVTQDIKEEVTPVTADEFMKQLATQMEIMLEIDKKIAEIKKENMELEKFIIEQEELEKGKILKEEAVKVIKQAKKAKLKRDDPKLAIFDKEWIDEVYGKEK